MRETRPLMGMPVTVEIAEAVTQPDIDAVFDFFGAIDQRFSTYKADSEISRINRGELALTDASEDMRLVFSLSEETKNQTNGAFDIVTRDGSYDPSGLVKGWAIQRAAILLAQRGFRNFFVYAGGDIQTSGLNARGEKWAIGIRNPFEQSQNVKVVYVSGQGVATSGTYVRGNHIYDPRNRDRRIDDIVSLTVIGPDIYEADRFATAAFAMGKEGIMFIEQTSGLEGYLIDASGIATMTTGFNAYTQA